MPPIVRLVGMTSAEGLYPGPQEDQNDGEHEKRSQADQEPAPAGQPTFPLRPTHAVTLSRTCRSVAAIRNCR
jgi:hypothetical protein